MATQLLPIDPDKKDDLYYRYKMPAVITKVEGSGNGIKTVIPNIHEICLSINRPEEVLMKFFQSELGAQRTVSTKDDKFLLMGSHATDRIQDKIYDFIRRFVLCRSCHNPETSVELDTARKRTPTLSMVCGACGERSRFLEHRVLTAMVLYYQRHPDEAKRAKGTAEARKKEAQEADGALAVSSQKKDAVSLEKSDLPDNREDITMVLARDFKECGDNIPELIGRVVRLLSQYNLKEAYAPALIINALLHLHRDDLLSALKRYAGLLRRFSTVSELFSCQEAPDEKELTELLKREAKIQKSFLKECANVCERYYDADKMAVLVFMLFIEGVLRDTNIALWAHDAKQQKGFSRPELLAEMKAKVLPLLEWLGLPDTPVAVQEEGGPGDGGEPKRHKKKDATIKTTN